MDLRNLPERLEEAESLDAVAERVQKLSSALLPRGPLKDVLHGVWLGHPLHPMLTDLPIGFWTGAFVLDFFGGEHGERSADTMVGLGVLAALPTAVAGSADWSELDTEAKRSGIVHAMANGAATVMYAASWLARRRGRRGLGLALSVVGATAATVGGHLGGHLTYRRQAGVNRSEDAPKAEDFTRIEAPSDMPAGEPSRAELDGQPLALVAPEDGEPPRALFAKCSHLGGPLDEGEVVDGCLRCPWHASTFRLEDGAVRSGPATTPQPAYEVRRSGGGWQARRRPAP